MDIIENYLIALWTLILFGGLGYYITRMILRGLHRRPRITVAFPIRCAACGLQERNTNLKFQYWRGKWYDEFCIPSIKEVS